jgi:hypothetical protein
MNQEPDIQSGISNARLAVLIDAENVSVDLWPQILRLLALLGTPTVIRAYTCGKRGKWPSISGIEVIDGGAAVAGPNAADFLLAFDAGKLLVSDAADRFVIVSNDDGFAPLICALQLADKPTSIIVPASGAIVDRKCVRVADVTMLVPQPMTSAQAKATQQPQSKSKANVSGDAGGNRLSKMDETTIRNIIEARSTLPDGWASLMEVGHDFVPHKAMKGTGKLSTFLASLDFIEIRDIRTTQCAVRLRRALPANP